MTNKINDHVHQEYDVSSLIEADLTDFSDVELLELFLGFHTTFKDGLALARICERRFGSLSKLISASPPALVQAGLPFQAVLAFKFLNAINQRTACDVAKSRLLDVGCIANSPN